MCMFLPAWAGAECEPCVASDSMCLGVSITVDGISLDLEATAVRDQVEGC